MKDKLNQFMNFSVLLNIIILFILVYLVIETVIIKDMLINLGLGLIQNV